jgi:predicted DNA-binding protein (MmcQ/YjbR family)
MPKRRAKHPRVNKREDVRLTKIARLALAFPEATRRDHGDYSAFLIRKRTFAYFLNNHHGDGIVAVTCKVMPAENAALVAAQKNRFYLPAYIGPKGWVALRLDIGKIDWDEVSDLLTASYTLIAPTRLASRYI